MPFASDDPAPVPGYRNYSIYCDESGQSGKVFYGFGSLWLPWERRGDLTGLVGALRDKHRYHYEIKWNRIDVRNQGFYQELIEQFFKRNWLMFHCLIGRKGHIDRSLHRGGHDEALRKHFALLIRKKISFFSGTDPRKVYHIVVDKLPSRYQKADEAAHVIVNHTLKKEMGFMPVHAIVTRDSRDSVGIQVADVLLGAVVTSWNRESSGPPKRAIQDFVAEHLGWRHLRADTRHWEWKFNIWYFHASGDSTPREARSWALNLKYPVPAYMPRGKPVRSDG